MTPTNLAERSVRKLLALLLGSPRPVFGDADAIDWPSLLHTASANVCTIRAYERLRACGYTPPSEWSDRVEHERGRIQITIDWIGRLVACCEREGVACCFPKALQHLPDMGHDIDCFLADRRDRMDRVFMREFGAEPIPNSWTNAVAGKRAYRLGPSIDLEVHHGRMGHVGEHARFPLDVLAHRSWETVAGIRIPTPSPEDQLLIQALQRIYGHFSLRISDLLRTVALVQAPAFDWRRVIAAAKRHGMFDGLCYYLSYVMTIVAPIGGRSWLPTDFARQLRAPRCGKITVVKHHFRFPTLMVASRVYGRKLLHDLVGRQWSACGRLCMIPLLTVAVLGRHLLQGLTSPPPPAKPAEPPPHRRTCGW